MRCIETNIAAAIVTTKTDKLQHEMYWNDATDDAATN